MRIAAKRQRDHRRVGTDLSRAVTPLPVTNATDEDDRLVAWLRNAQFTDVSHLLTKED